MLSLVLMADISIWRAYVSFNRLPFNPAAQSRFCERRKSLRWEIHIPVTLSSTYLAEGMICNLSTGGCAVRAMSSYHHGEEILLVFVLPGAGQVTIRAAVRVG
jgi:hypothetical protein